MRPKKSPSEEAAGAQSLRPPRTASLKTKPKTPKLVGNAVESVPARGKSSATKPKTTKLIGDAPASASLRRGKVESITTKQKLSATKQKLAKLVGEAVEGVSPRTKSTAAKQKPPKLVGDAPASAGLPPSSDFGAASRRGRVESVPTRQNKVVFASKASKPPSKLAAAKQKTAGLIGDAGMEQHKVPTPRGLGSVPTRPARKQSTVEPPLMIPAILLEGDEPAARPVSGPGQKYALGPIPPTGHSGSEEGELPEAYGTKKLMLIPRDPHWLYAHWDLTNEQQRRYNALSADRHLVIRVYRGAVAGEPVSETHVHPESRHWFIHVVQAETKYVAELGYFNPGGRWVAISVSAVASTPSDSESSDRSMEFATMPQRGLQSPAAAKEKWFKMTEFALEREFLDRALAETPIGEQVEWTAAHERALAEVIGLDEERRHWINSMEISELIRKQAEREISSITAAQLGLQARPGASESISSPPGGRQPQARGFWVNLNAELIIYGATEPNATVTVAGRPIKLRPDGTFSFRFALPDGQYQLAVTATSTDNDQRQAELKFGRRTEYKGEVGTHPQDKTLPRMTTAK